MRVFGSSGYYEMRFNEPAPGGIVIKVAFFDIDGTLISDRTGHRIPQDTRDALIELRRRGVTLAIASGRSPAQLPPCITGGFPGLEDAFDVYVTLSGSLCYDASGVFHETPMHRASKERFCAHVAEGRFDALALMRDRVISNRHSEKVAEMERLVGTTFPAGDFGRVLEEPCYQFCAFVPPKRDAWVRELMPDCIIARWSDLFCDVIPAESSKPRGVQATLDHLGLTREEAIAFGDGGNDTTMLEYVGTGVAMGNGTPEAKVAADYITDDVDKGGIAHALAHFGLI